MAQQAVEFQFKHIGCQGVHISSYTPSRLSDYTEKIAIPAESGYHVVGCYLPFLISNMNSWNLVEGYMEASERHARTIIDVCLPYHDVKSRKTFLGRYIFYAGLLVGIRLNTNASEMVPNYSSWPKHKSKVVVFSMGKQEKEEIILGEFSLKLANATIGLLFQSELRTSANEYMNYGYDILVLTYESIHPQSKLLGIKNELSKKAYVIESFVGNFQNKINPKKIGQMSQQNKEEKGVIYVDYYDLNKIFKLKQYSTVISKQICQVTAVIIDLILNQQNVLKKMDRSSEDLFLRYTLASKAKQQPIGEPKLSQDPQIDIFIRRLYKLYLLSNFTKIILVIEESPSILCFLYIIKHFTNIIRKKNPDFQPSQLFTFINLQNFRFNLLAQKFEMFQSKHEQDSDQNCKDDLEIKILKHFNEIMEVEKNQQFFVVVTSNERIMNVVRLMNERENVNLRNHFNLNQSEGGNTSESLNRAQIVLRTWVGCDFFTPQELKDIYFGCTIKSVIEDRQYFGELWLKYVNIETVFKNKHVQKMEEIIDLNLNEIEINGIFNVLNLSEILKESNMIVYQFRKLIAELEERGCFGWQNGLFSHYLFRKINAITYFSQPDYVQKGTRNFIEQLAILDKQTLLPTFQLITFNNFTLNDRLQHRLTLRKIGHIRQQHSSKQQCHGCMYPYPSSLIYQCKNLICRQYFCYQCLIETKSIQPHELKRRNTADLGYNLVSRCPACKGLCDLGCKRCEIKSICCKMRKKEGVKTGRRECHFCLKENALNYYNCANVDCKRFFCSKCIEEYYRDRSREYQDSGWHCYVCQERCNCNNCEVEKAAIRKVIAKIETKKEVEKELDRTKVKDTPKPIECPQAINLIEDSLEKDKAMDASFIDINEASTRLPKEFQVNLATSFGLAEQKKMFMQEKQVIQIEESEPALWVKGDLQKEREKMGKMVKQSDNKKNMLFVKNRQQQSTEYSGLESFTNSRSAQRVVKQEHQENRSAQIPPNPLEKSSISTKSTNSCVQRPTNPSMVALKGKIKTKPLTFDFAQPLSGKQYDY